MLQNTEISLGADICRSTKKDVLKIIRGPSKLGEAKNGFLLSALSHLKLIFAAGAARLKKDKKGRAEVENRKPGQQLTSHPPWKGAAAAAAGRLPDLSKVKLAGKKIDFYLSWVVECYQEYELFYR